MKAIIFIFTYSSFTQTFIERYETRTSLGRTAIEDNFCGAMTFLASDMLVYVAGQNLSIDSGWGIW